MTPNNQDRMSFVVLVLFCCVRYVFSACNFPEYLPEAGVWTATYSNKGYLTANFKRDILDAMYCPAHHTGQCIKYERKCIQEVETGKYLVQHTPKGRDSFGQHSQYMCIQFIRRSNFIVQMKTSIKLNYQNPDFCSEHNLRLDHFPILSPHMMKSEQITCPLKGGYNMRIRGPEGELCMGKLVLPRMESECESGDGITFNFRYKECLHKNLQMKLKQTVRCVTSWNHGKYTFVILRPDSTEFEAWCLRITNSPDSVQQIHLFMEPVCDPGTGNGHGQITETTNYLSISLNRINIPSVCANEFEGCNEGDFCKTPVSNYCYRTCGQCKSEVDLCTFPEDMQGSWLLDSQEGLSMVNISAFGISMPKLGRFKCLSRNVSEDGSKTVLLHVFDNGCFPRFSCLEILSPSTSVRQFRMGKPLNWPMFPIVEAEKKACQYNKFRDYIEIAGSYRKEEIPKQVILHHDQYFSTYCQLPESLGFHGKSLYFTEGDKCNGCLLYDPAFRPDKMDIVTINCSHAAKHIQYICLSNFDFDENTKAVLTGTDFGPGQKLQNFLCWVFTLDGKKKVIIVLKAGDCNKLTVERVLDGELQPTAKFDIYDFPPGTCPTDSDIGSGVGTNDRITRPPPLSVNTAPGQNVVVTEAPRNTITEVRGAPISSGQFRNSGQSFIQNGNRAHVLYYIAIITMTVLFLVDDVL